MSTTYHVQIVLTETTKPVPAKVDSYNRKTTEEPKERRSEELVRVGVTKDSEAEALAAAMRLLSTMQRSTGEVRAV